MKIFSRDITSFVIAVGTLLSVQQSLAFSDNPECGPGTFCSIHNRRDLQGTRDLQASGFTVLTLENGKVTLSIDGVGHTGSALIGVQKPSAAATVRKAYLFASTFVNLVPAVSLESVPVVWGGTAVNLFLHSFYADVTSIIKTQLDSFVSGVYPSDTFLHIDETESSDLIDGEILAVIWDDPDQTTDNTATLMFGALSSAGDSFNVNFKDPVDKNNPNLQIDLSLGIGYGAGPEEGQFSIVTVNGQLLSAVSGGFDDGVLQNGQLLTVGDYKDSNQNPADPNASQDDELYTLVPFVSNGDKTVLVETVNPSADDVIFFAGVFTNLKAAVNSECGNGVINLGEECDDGNVINGDGCSAVCTNEFFCGNGLLDVGEECDDGNLISGDGCAADCKIEPCLNEINSFTLVDAARKFDIMPLGDYSKRDMPTYLNIRANPRYCLGPKKVESVLVKFDRESSLCEKFTPYAVFGDPSSRDTANNVANYNRKTIQVGTHTVTATPYDGENCRGNKGPTFSQTFVVST